MTAAPGGRGRSATGHGQVNGRDSGRPSLQAPAPALTLPCSGHHRVSRISPPSAHSCSATSHPRWPVGTRPG